MPLPPPLADLVREAVGKAHRNDPVTDSAGGPAGNARMTAWTGLIVLMLVLAQLVTLLGVGHFITWHIVVGSLLVPFALLKTASTFWRIGRYYTGHRPYRSAGAPGIVLRVLGPLVVLSTLGLLASGLVLVALGPSASRRPFVAALGQQVSALTLHQAIFFVFAAAASLHLLARLVPALQLVTGRRSRAMTSRPERVPGGARRATALMATLSAAVMTAALVLAASSGWRQDHRAGGPHRHFSSRSVGVRP